MATPHVLFGWCAQASRRRIRLSVGPISARIDEGDSMEGRYAGPRKGQPDDNLSPLLRSYNNPRKRNSQGRFVPVSKTY